MKILKCTKRKMIKVGVKVEKQEKSNSDYMDINVFDDIWCVWY